MASTPEHLVPESEREIVMTRVINAPRELVWEAYTNPAHISQWYGPKGFTITTYEMDVRVGGVWRFMMHAPDGTDFPSRQDYTEVVRRERLAFLYGERENDPEAMDCSVTFTDQGGKTLITQRMVFRTKAQYEATIGFGAVELGYQTLDKLAAHVAGMA